jgi:hypothetical protein
LGAILNTLADILNTFSATVLPFMQDGILAAATSTSHGDHQVRNVRSNTAALLQRSPALTLVVAGLRCADEGRRRLRETVCPRLRGAHRRRWPQGLHLQVRPHAHPALASS